jgi:hypothetical protein
LIFTASEVTRRPFFLWVAFSVVHQGDSKEARSWSVRRLPACVFVLAAEDLGFGEVLIQRETRVSGRET